MYQTSAVDKRLSMLLISILLLASTICIHSQTSSEPLSTPNTSATSTTATFAASTLTTTTTTSATATTTSPTTITEVWTNPSTVSATSLPSVGDIRLAGSSTSNQGRVEVYYDAVWGTVCGDDFDDIDAGVVCNILGYGNTGSVVEARYGPGTGQIWLNNVQCVGNELSIANCSHGGWGVNNCSHSKDVSVLCGTSPLQYDVRLAGSSVSNEGRLEVYYSGVWGTVCEKEFAYIDAGVVCNSLGYGYTGTVVGTRYGPGTGEIWLDDVHCVGNEASIADCGHGGWGVHNCDHSRDVSVLCGTSPVEYGPLSNLDNFFIVADSYLRNIYQVDMISGNTSQLLLSGTAINPYSLAYDSINESLYWTDYDARTINRYSLRTNSTTVLYRDPLGQALYNRLAIDTERQKLYVTDMASGEGKIVELSTDGTDYRVVITGDGDFSPSGVVFDNVKSKLYWTDAGANTGIYRSSLDNPVQETLVTGNLQQPDALTIDFTAGVMYWGDSYEYKIETSSINGTERRILLEDSEPHYNAFAHYDGYIFFTDMYSPSIRTLDVATRSTSVISAAIPFHQLEGIVFVPPTYTDVSTVETNLVIMTILASVGGVIVIAFFMICVVAIRRRRRANKRAAKDAQQRYFAEKHKQQQQTSWEYPIDEVYDEIDDDGVYDDINETVISSLDSEQSSIDTDKHMTSDSCQPPSPPELPKREAKEDYSSSEPVYMLVLPEI